MPKFFEALITLIGRFLLIGIFLMSAVGNKIPHFSDTVSYMKSEGVPAPAILLVGAIVFLIAGSLSILLGYKARVGGLLLLIFLVLATYWFHDFWTFKDAGEQKMQMIQFMKNVALMGSILLIIARGSGKLSLDNRISKPPKQ